MIEFKIIKGIFTYYGVGTIVSKDNTGCIVDIGASLIRIENYHIV